MRVGRGNPCFGEYEHFVAPPPRHFAQDALGCPVAIHAGDVIMANAMIERCFDERNGAGAAEPPGKVRAAKTEPRMSLRTHSLAPNALAPLIEIYARTAPCAGAKPAMAAASRGLA